MTLDIPASCKALPSFGAHTGIVEVALRVLIVDDNAHFLDAAHDLLDREGMTVVGVASTSVDALRLTEELRPDIILVDIDLGEASGFDLAAKTRGCRTSKSAGRDLDLCLPRGGLRGN